MPELPEVETVVRGLRPDLIGRTIEAATLDWAKSLVMPDPLHFNDRIAGQKVIDVQRRAKYIMVKLDADWLLIHLKMTGRLYIVPNELEIDADRWAHFRFQLDNGHQLRFSDSRKFGRVYLTEDIEPIVGHLGPEPLSDDFTLEAFTARLAKRSGKIKPLLLNQVFLAGVGNIYADEALHRAHIHPTRAVNSLTPEEIHDLYYAIRWVLNQGIERQGASVNWYRDANGEKGTMQEALFVYDRQGQPCLTCGSAMIEKIVVGQRGTHYCPNCQR